MVPSDLSSITDNHIGGWISPEGLFFRAHYFCHDEVAAEIVENYLHVHGVFLDSDYLIEKGWVRLETSGDINYARDLTGQQEDILYTCYVKSQSEWYKEMLYDCIAPVILGATTVREPMPRVPPQGDQENYRRVYA